VRLVADRQLSTFRGGGKAMRDSGMPADRGALGRWSTSELFALDRGIFREVRARGVVRTETAPAGDDAEYLVARALSGTLVANCEKSYDVVAHGVRLQVKARVVSDPSRSGQLRFRRSARSTLTRRSSSS
jgi:hypothetical protein